MKQDNGQLRFFASDLMRFQGCRHATTLDLRYLETRDLSPAADSDEAQLVQDHGHAHERAFIDRLRSSGREVVIAFAEGMTLEDAVLRTKDVMRAGPDVIAQAAFASGQWAGYADLLYRTERPSGLGRFSYEVADTKLSRSAKPAQVLQLCLYSQMLAEVQQLVPANARLELGNGGTVTVRLADVAAYAREARRQFERFVEDRPATRPEPVAACSLCRWRAHCEGEWKATDSLVKVAGIQRSQRQKIEAAGVTTLTALAQHTGPVPRLAAESLHKLVTHAQLQSRRRAGGQPEFVARPIEPGRGFSRLPEPDEGDLFYDIEGDPFVEGGLEYLHGVWFREAGGWRFREFIGHDRREEGVALSGVLHFFEERLKVFPRAHIYHYAAYELTALRRLTKQHRMGEALLDQLQRDQKFVDLYAVVSGAILASEGGYSVKDLEAFYMKRSGEVATAGASIVAYETWRQTRDEAVLQSIIDYNRVDCQSIQQLRDWLVTTVRPAGLPWPTGGEGGKPIDLEKVKLAEDKRMRCEDPTSEPCSLW